MKNVYIFFVCLWGVSAFCLGSLPPAVEDFPFLRKEREEVSKEMKEPPRASNYPTLGADVFFAKFFGVDDWCVVGREKKNNAENEYVFELFSQKKMTDCLLSLAWLPTADVAKSRVLDDFLSVFPRWSEFNKYYSAVAVGSYGITSVNSCPRQLSFYRGEVIVSLSFSYWANISDTDVLSLGNAIDALLCGKAEFLPEDDLAFVEIRAEWEREKERRLQREREATKKRHEEFLARERAQRIEEAKAGVLPDEFYEERAALGSEIEAFSARMKEKGGNVFSDAPSASASRPPVIPLTASVPVAGERDADAWRKLSVSRARSVFSDWEEWRNVAADWHPLFFSFRMHKERKLPGDSETDWVCAEVVHAGTPAEARKWAAYLRFKYMDKSERSRGDAPEQIARATNADAFPGLGNENISWRGRMSPAFLPDEKTAETLIVFIRGTTVVCLKSERPDFSVLPFARAFDALLLAPAPAADAEPEPPAE